MTLGQRLKKLRESKNLARDKFANIIGLTYWAVSKYETDDRFPDQETLIKIADFFGVSIDYLLGRTDNSQTNQRKITGPKINSQVSQDDLELVNRIKGLSGKDRKILETILGHMEYKNGNGDEEAAAGE
jgi:transcriptional regulator with XRE-family HTH domain